MGRRWSRESGRRWSREAGLGLRGSAFLGLFGRGAEFGRREDEGWSGRPWVEGRWGRWGRGPRGGAGGSEDGAPS